MFNNPHQPTSLDAAADAPGGHQREEKDSPVGRIPIKLTCPATRSIYLSKEEADHHSIVCYMSILSNPPIGGGVRPFGQSRRFSGRCVSLNSVSCGFRPISSKQCRSNYILIHRAYLIEDEGVPFRPCNGSDGAVQPIKAGDRDGGDSLLIVRRNPFVPINLLRPRRLIE